MTSKQPEFYKAFATLTPELKAAVLAEAESGESNMTDVIVAKLAARFGIPFEPTGRTPSRGNPDQLDVVLRMPVALYRRLVTETVREMPVRRVAITEIVCETLDAAYEGSPA